LPTIFVLVKDVWVPIMSDVIHIYWQLILVGHPSFLEEPLLCILTQFFNEWKSLKTHRLFVWMCCTVDALRTIMGEWSQTPDMMKNLAGWSPSVKSYLCLDRGWERVACFVNVISDTNKSCAANVVVL
jgi:hypothetical protein